jgi:hypothetical protein
VHGRRFTAEAQRRGENANSENLNRDTGVSPVLAALNTENPGYVGFAVFKIARMDEDVHVTGGSLCVSAPLR